jgi:glutamate-1-semialdehyde aminotransferase
MDAAFKDVRASRRGKEWIVRFKSAYHGHISGVDFLNGQKQIFLDECNPKSLKFIQDYHYRIAAVVVNPMQHFTGVNKPSPPGEKLTAGKRIRSAIPKDDYARWLHSIADTCKYCSRYLTKIAFIVDDIYFAFRTPELFSTKYFSHPETNAPLRPDVLVLGKGVAAGYPLSMVLGRNGYLNSYDKKFLLQVNKTVGTLSAWYGGIVASNVFLEAISGKCQTLQVTLPVTAEEQLKTMIIRFDDFTLHLNQRFEEKDLPVRIRSFSNTFSIDYLSDSIYNSRYPQYLIAEGIYFGNYSTGKFNINADATDEDLMHLANKFISAAVRMQEDGFFEPTRHKFQMYMSLAYRFYVNFVRIYYDQMMEDKRIDIEVSHNHPVNKFGHFWSSVGQLVLAYPWCFYYGETVKGCLAFFFAHVIRQSGHFFYEHQDRDIEKLKFGHKDGSKKMAVVFIALAGLIYYHRNYVWQLFENYNMDLSMSEYMSLVALFTIVPHFVEITHEFVRRLNLKCSFQSHLYFFTYTMILLSWQGYLRGLEWIIKILTDPLTDLYDFYDYWIIDLKYFLDFKDPKAVYKLDLATKKIIKVN